MLTLVNLRTTDHCGCPRLGPWSRLTGPHRQSPARSKVGLCPLEHGPSRAKEKKSPLPGWASRDECLLAVVRGTECMRAERDRVSVRDLGGELGFENTWVLGYFTTLYLALSRARGTAIGMSHVP